MVSPHRSTPSVPKKAHITYTPHQVALMAQFANDLSPDFCRAATPHLEQAFLGRIIEHMVSVESPFIPRCLQTYFGVKQNRKGGYTWIPR